MFCSNTGYQKWFLLTLRVAINLKVLQWQILFLVLQRGFFATNVNLFPLSTQPHWGLQVNQVNASFSWRWNTTANCHTRQREELVQNYVARLNLHKEGQKEQLQSGIHLVWSYTTSPPKTAYRSRHALADFLEVRQSKSSLPTHPLAWAWSPGLSLVLFGFLGSLGNLSSLHIRLKTWQIKQMGLSFSIWPSTTGNFCKKLEL